MLVVASACCSLFGFNMCRHLPRAAHSDTLWPSHMPLIRAPRSKPHDPGTYLDLTIAYLQ